MKNNTEKLEYINIIIAALEAHNGLKPEYGPRQIDNNSVFLSNLLVEKIKEIEEK